MEKRDDSGALLRDFRKPRHYTIDNEFLDQGYAAELGVYASMAYNVLCRFANYKTSQAFPSYTMIAKLTGNNVYCLLNCSEWRKLEKGAQNAPIIKKGAQHAPKNGIKGAHGAFVNGAQHAPDQTNNMVGERTTTTTNENVVDVVVLNALIQKFNLTEPAIKLQRVITDNHITDMAEVDKALTVATQRAKNPAARISYIRNMFFDGKCTENPSTTAQQQPHTEYADISARLRGVM